MSTGPQSSLTILFEAPFWIGLYERTDNGKYGVCKITFGSEPKDYELSLIHILLPRKTFSMGEAHDKRFYLEARKIR